MGKEGDIKCVDCEAQFTASDKFSPKSSRRVCRCPSGWILRHSIYIKRGRRAKKGGVDAPTYLMVPVNGSKRETPAASSSRAGVNTAAGLSDLSTRTRVSPPSECKKWILQKNHFLLAHRDSVYPFSLAAVNRNFLPGSIRNFSPGRDTRVGQPLHP
jgi:hypothetical protein